MVTKLYYFSGTGNSLVIARDLAQALGNAEVVPIAKTVKSEQVTPDCEAIGIIFPVYSWGPPIIVREFIKKLNCTQDTYIFSVATYAAIYCGTFKILNPLFSQILRLKRRRFCSDKDLRLNETRSIVALCENRVQE